MRFFLVAQKTTRVHPSPRVCFVMTAEADADEKGNVVNVTKVRAVRAVEDYGYCRYRVCHNEWKCSTVRPFTDGRRERNSNRAANQR